MVGLWCSTTTTTTNNNTHVLVTAVWQVETAGGGGNMFQLQAIRLWGWVGGISYGYEDRS